MKCLDNIVWVATIAGIALGIGVILAIIITKNKEETGVVYSYDSQSRVQSVVPMGQQQYVKLVPVGE